MKLSIDKSIPIPVYYQLKEQLSLQIRDEIYPVGSQLPTEKAISENLDISRGTVRQAFNGLVSEGKLHRIPGKGTFVSDTATSINLVARRLTSLAEEMREKNIPFTSQILSKKIIPAEGRLLNKLNLNESDKIIYLERLGKTNNEPFVLAYTYIPEKLVSGIFEIDLMNTSFYKILKEEYGLNMGGASRTLEAALAGEHESKLLEIPEGSPIHFMQSLAYLENGNPIEYSRLRFRGDRSRISFNISQNIAGT
jgi:GntR family transcriptional regulator